MDKERFWDILAWIGFGIVVMYFFLKAFGVLNSPLSADIVTIIGGSIFIGRHIQKVEHISKHADKSDNRLSFLENKVNDIDNKLFVVENRLVAVENRLVAVERIVNV